MAYDVQRENSEPHRRGEMVLRHEEDGFPDRADRAGQKICKRVLCGNEKGKIQGCGPAAVLLREIGGVQAYRAKS